MNVDKGAAVASVILLAVMLLASWRVEPELEKIGEHRREGLRPMQSDSEVALESPDVSPYLALDNNPFMWKGEIPKGPPPKPNDIATGETGSKLPKPKPPKPKPPKPKPPEQPPPVPPMPPPKPQHEWKLPIAYVGTVKVRQGGRSRQAIFKDEEAGGYIKLAKGQEYKGVKLIEVKANSVILLNKKGKRFVLPKQ